MKGQAADLPREVDAAEQSPHPPFYLNEIPQGVGLRSIDRSGVTHFREQLRDDIVLGLDLVRQQWGAEELFESIDDAVDEFED